MIKLQAPQAALRIYSDAIQAHGAAEVADDYGLVEAFSGLRSFRLADGSDEIHARSIARLEFAKHPPEKRAKCTRSARQLIGIMRGVPQLKGKDNLFDNASIGRSLCH